MGRHYSCTSDRDAKHDFETVQPDEILSQVSKLPLSRWRFRNRVTPHIGPIGAGLLRPVWGGPDEKHLSPTDTAGVALAAIQGLYQQLQLTRKPEALATGA